MCAPLGGREDRSKPCRPRQKRLQTPYADLRTGHPARALCERRQPQRHPRAAAARGRDPARARQTRPTPPPAAAAARRRRLSLPPPPPSAARPRHQRRDQPTEATTRLRPRQAALGRRAHDRLAAPVPSPPCPLRTPRRHPRSLPPNRRLPDLPQTPPSRGVILLGALTVVVGGEEVAELAAAPNSRWRL